ncbi:acyltransferase family protein [Pseudorhodoplanes sinuspersici]|uniref:acyltransferase family protein n=1 Tax=Pseudorhodoplanes sinuspersici TaxID=1235591 RepID=UPI000FF4B9A2|nr:acyltransferase family protein [Pseudorhodoplanes sinuspersici]RKE69784.1 peptidoglycan/LPS O-acetylase OafA/YrhL [Pseudorhodoplanes sinuspersici]
MPFAPASKIDTFRTDIEGLRALAILPILLFHLDPSWAPGGFAGVDIFFVISGYLISGQILKAEAGKFQFLSFYWRRIRRLFPALAVTVAITLAVSWRLLTPGDFKALAWSSIASLLGVANIHFLLSVDYFNESSLLHPLLHVWSLSVEEQFYLIWPAFLILLAAGGKKTLTRGVISLGLLSLAASALFTGRAPYLAFYMMPFRIFEFAIGAAVFLLAARPSRPQSMVYGLIGAALLIAAIVLFDVRTPWPAANALLPCLATALLLIAGHDGFWHKTLSAQPLRLLGRISYSVYLVHWPLIVLYRTWIVVPPTLSELLGLLIVSILLGALLYIFVERFYRVSNEPKISWLFVGSIGMRSIGARLEAFVTQRQAALFASFLVVPALTLCISGIVIARNGFPDRMSRDRVQKAAGELSFAGDLCSSARSRCTFGDPASQKIVYLVGDSHALNLVYGLDRLFKEAGIRGIAIYDHGCLFLRGTQRFQRGVPDRTCARNVADAFNQLARDRHPVIFAGNYGGYNREIGLAGSGEPFEGSGRDYIAWIETHLRDSLEALGADERPVVIVSSAYNTGIDTAKCAAQFGDADPKCVPQSLESARNKTAAIDAMIVNVGASVPGLTILDPKISFCDSTHCVVRDNGLPFFRDNAHLTNEGSAFLIGRLKPALLSALLAKQ